MIRRIVIPCMLIILMVSCNQDIVFQQRHTFPNMTWNRLDNILFETNITDVSKPYNLLLDIRHHTLYPYPNLLLTFVVSTPSGERRIRDLNIKLKDAQGKFLASGMGDLWDITTAVYHNFTFTEPGKYTFELENRMPKYDTPGLLEIGLTVRAIED